MSKIFEFREQWLQAAVGKLRPLFLGAGYTVPELYVSCSFPSRGATSAKKRVLGQCWSGTTSADGKPHLFITPFLVLPTDPQGVLPTLVHEMVHSVLPEAKHGPAFRAAMKKVGLAGKPTATHADEGLIERLALLANELGDYPHSEISILSVEKKQTTRMKKAECPCCGYTVRLTQKWADVGLPACPADANALVLSEPKIEAEPESE